MSGAQPAEEFLVHPRYLAGTGEITDVLQPLVDDYGWFHRTVPATAHTPAGESVTSHCGRIEVVGERAVFHLWRVSIRRHWQDSEPLWKATFTQDTPVEIVSALTLALAQDRELAPEEIVAEDFASPTTAWRPLLKAGWIPKDLSAVVLDDGNGGTVAVHGADEGGTVIDGIRVTSPDRTCSLVHRPRPDEAFDTGVGPWMIEAAFGPHWADQWTAILSAATPVRYLHKLTRAVVDPAPVRRTRDQVSDATRTAAHVRPATAPPRPHHPFAHGSPPYTAARPGRAPLR